MQDFRELKVWQKSHGLTLAVYRLTAGLPRTELFGLTSQMRRAAASIGANIAEGCGRNGGADLARFLQIASGSASELENHALLARDLGFVARDAADSLATDIAEVKRMLYGLMQSVRHS